MLTRCLRSVFSSYAILYDELSDFEPERYQDLALQEARTVVWLISIVATVDFGSLDIFISACWRMTAPILLREAHRLRKKGASESGSFGSAIHDAPH